VSYNDAGSSPTTSYIESEDGEEELSEHDDISQINDIEEAKPYER